MRQRFSEELHGRVVGGWHLENAHWPVPWFPVCWQGTAPRDQGCKKLFKASRTSSLLPRHSNDC